MTQLYRKMDFLNMMLKKSIITNKIVRNFFKDIYADGFLLQRVQFHLKPMTISKYSILIDTKKKYVLCHINGKYYKNDRYIKHILRALKENRSLKIDVCILSQKEKFNKEYFNVCVNMDLVEDAINEAFVDLMLLDIQKDYVMKLIDEALENGDEEKFNELHSQYMNLLI